MNDSGSTDAPMTRAQKFQWYLEKGMAEGLRPLPTSMDEHSARQLLRALEDRFEILRTSLDIVEGELRQRVHGSGSPLLAVDTAPGSSVQECMSGLVEGFKAREHGRVGRFLVQFYLLRDEERRWLAVVADNVAIDAGFHSVLDEEISGILHGRTDTASTILKGQEGLQPAGTALWEAGPQGDAERLRALAYLRHHFSIAPPRLHPTRPSRGLPEGRFYRCTLTLRGADDIFSGVISSIGLLPSALILAAFSQLMCWRSEADSCAVNVSLDNRHNSELRRVLCATAQRSPVALPQRGQSVLHAATEVQRALSEHHPVYGRYDPFDYIRERVQAQHRQGVCLSTDLAFNFIPPPQGWTNLLLSSGGDALDRPRAVSEVVRKTTEEIAYEYGASLSVRWSDSRTARLSVHGDSDVLTPEQCEALLRGIELMLERARSKQDCVVGEVASEVGLLRRRRAPHERRVRGRWVDLKALEDRLLAMGGVEKAQMVLGSDEVSGSDQLTASVVVAPGVPMTPLDLREGLLTAVETGEILITPDWYEIVGGTLADGGGSGVIQQSGDGRTVARRPPATDEEKAVQGALEESRLVQELDLDLCYVRAAGELQRYPELAERLRRRGYIPPDFALVSGMSTLRQWARELRRIGPVDA
ncbi:hypothetical protein RB625_24770 [Streptomyces californicus]|uniref:hypothetical protein n=1 Tax=Streptomyces californicus TaxID=67351 RepID=UPI00296FC564|nr:hypothetical protein [Streptomyces californicus]MDW4901633.1 hypothetical protein [Streptomyces californicus]